MIEQFLQFKALNQGKADTTIVKYRGYLQRLAKFLTAKQTELLRASQQDLEEFVGLHMHQAGLCPRSRRAVVAAVRGFYAWAHHNGAIAANPANSLPYPDAANKKPVPMQLANAEKLIMLPDIDTFVGVRDAAMIALLIGCGLRLSGLVGLNESSLFFIDDDGQERLIVRVEEKGKKERLVPVPDEARILLRLYLGHAELKKIDRTLPNGDRVLFVSVRNRMISPADYYGARRRISPRSVHHLIARYAKAAGIPLAEGHPHAMRHLYGTELAEEDISLLVSQALLGHSDTKSTEIYSHLAMRKLTRAASRANPLRKIRTPVTDLLKALRDAP